MRIVTSLVFATLVTIFMALPIIASDLASLGSSGSNSGVPHARAFEFTYQVTIDPVPTGTLRVWIPVATSDPEAEGRLEERLGSGSFSKWARFRVREFRSVHGDREDCGAGDHHGDV